MSIPPFTQRTKRTKRIGSGAKSATIRASIVAYNPFPRVGVVPRRVDGVFEGGGALGAAYCGALRALDDNQIWFARVAGNSAGAITAAMVAAGFTAAEIQWLSSGYVPRPAKPASLAAGFEPILFSTFLDLPTPATVARTSMHKTMLWQALKGPIIDHIGATPLPIPVQGPTVEACITALRNAGGGLGALIANFPGADALLRAALNVALAPLPNSALHVRDFLPDTSQLRTAFADAVWQDIAKRVPVLLLMTNLLHEGSVFEGNVFLNTIKGLLGRKLHNDPTRDVTFNELPIPLAVIATDIDRGCMVVYSGKTTPNMSVAEAVRQSMSVPFVFQPRAKGHIVDGGLCSNFPVWLFSTGGVDQVVQVGGDDARAKIGFVLQESQGPRPTWSVQPARFETTGTPPRVDDMPVVKPILLEKLRELRIVPLVQFPDVAAGQDVDQLAVINEISGMLGLDREGSTRIQIAKGLMGSMSYFDVVIPLLGYHWLDFYVNEDEDDVIAMWDRGWHASVDSLGAAPLTGVGNAMILNAVAQQSPYAVT